MIPVSNSTPTLRMVMICLQPHSQMPPWSWCPSLPTRPVSEPDSWWPVNITSEEKPLAYSQINNSQVPEATWASLMAQMVKNQPAMQETQIWSLEKGMATHSSTLAWRIPWTKEPGGLQSMGSQRIGHYWAVNTDWPEAINLGLQNT